MTEHGRQAPNRFVRSLPAVAGAVVAAASVVFLVRAFGYHGRPGSVASWSLATANWALTGVV